MPLKVKVNNPHGEGTEAEYMVFPDYIPYDHVENAIREKYPNKKWPEESAEVSPEPSMEGKGFWGEFSTAWGDAFDQAQEDLAIGTAILNSSRHEALTLLEEEYQKWKKSPDESKKYPILSGGFLGETFGSVSRDIAAGLATGVPAGFLTTPLGGIIAGGSTVAGMQGVTAKGGSMRNTYFGERYKQDQQNVQDIEAAYDTAKKVSNNDATVAVAEAGASTLVPVPGVGKGLTRVGTKVGNELMFDAAIGASGSAFSDAYAEAEGVDRGDKLENAFRSGLQEMIGGAIPTGIRGASEWGRYVTERRKLETSIDANNKAIEDNTQRSEASNNPEVKKILTADTESRQKQNEFNQKRLDNINKENNVELKPKAKDRKEKPTQDPEKKVFAPVFDEQGGLTGSRALEPFESVKAQEKISNNPEGYTLNTYSEEFHQTEDGKLFIDISGRKYEAYPDGTISQSPLVTNPLGTANQQESSFNDGGKTSNRFDADATPVEIVTTGEDGKTASLIMEPAEFKYDLPESLSPEGTREFAGQIEKSDLSRVVGLTRKRHKEITDTAVPYYQRSQQYYDEKQALLNARNRKENPISQETFEEQLQALESAPIESKYYVEGKAVAAPKEEYRSIFSLLSNPEDPDTGPYPHLGDNSKIIKDEVSPLIPSDIYSALPKMVETNRFLYDTIKQELLPTAKTQKLYDKLSDREKAHLVNTVIHNNKNLLAGILDISVDTVPSQSTKVDNYLDALAQEKIDDLNLKQIEGPKIIDTTTKEEVVPKNRAELFQAKIKNAFEKAGLISPAIHLRYQTPKSWAWQFYNPELINAKNKDENTLLHLAAKEADEAKIKALVASGADINAVNAENQTAIDILRTKRKNKKTAERLINYLKGQGGVIGANAINLPTYKETKPGDSFLEAAEAVFIKDFWRFVGANNFPNNLSKLNPGTTYIDAEKEIFALENLTDALIRTQTFHHSVLAQEVVQKVVRKEVPPEKAAEEALSFGLHQEGFINADSFDEMAFAYASLKAAQRGEKINPEDYGLQVDDNKKIDPSKPLIGHDIVLPKYNPISEAQQKRINKAEVLERPRLTEQFKVLGDFKLVADRAKDALRFAWYRDTQNYYDLDTKKVQYALTQKLLDPLDVKISKPKNITKQQGKIGDVKSDRYKKLKSRLNEIRKYLKNSKKYDHVKVEEKMESQLKDHFAAIDETLNEYSKLITKRYAASPGDIQGISGIKIQPEESKKARHFFRDIMAGFFALGKVEREVFYSNAFFNPAGLSQIYRGLTGLAGHLSRQGVSNAVEFAKILNTDVTAAIKSAWNDGVKGIYHTMYSLPPKVLSALVKMLIPSRTTMEKMIGPNMMETMDNWWESFVHKYDLQQYKDQGKVPAVKALLKRNFIDRYYDLAEIMGRVGDGFATRAGTSLDERLMMIEDSVNAYYKLDAIETILGERMGEFNRFKEAMEQEFIANKVDPSEFQEFLYARHAPSRNKRMAERNLEFQDYQVEDKKAGSGMSDATAAEIISRIRTQGKFDLFQSLAERYIYSVTKQTLEVQYASGLITEQTYVNLQNHYENYVPLRRKDALVEDQIIRATGNTGGEVRGSEHIAALGSGNKAMDIIAHTFQQHSIALIRSERNKVMQSLAKWVEQNPENTEITKAKPEYIRKLTTLPDESQVVTLVNDPTYHRKHDVVAYKIDGKAKYLRIKNKALAHQFRNAGVSSIKSLTKGVGRLTKVLTRLNTQYNPAFVIPNFIRDIQYARLNLTAIQTEEFAKELANLHNIPALISPLGQKKKGVIWDALRTTTRDQWYSKEEIAERRKNMTIEERETADQWDAVLKEMVENGGRIAFYGINTFESQINDIQKLAKAVNNAKADKKPSLVKQKLKVLGEAIEAANGGLESATRLATYKLARDKGISPQKAAYLSRNITVNFTKKGVYGSALNDLFMFFNAGIQGSYNVYKSLKHTEKGKKIFFNIFAAGFGLEMLNQFFSGEDEKGISHYAKIPEWKRKNNLIFMNPITGKDAISIPMPYGYNVIHYLGAKTQQVARGAYLKASGYPTTEVIPNTMSAADAALHVMDTAANAFNPIGGSSTLARMITPDVLDPIIDLNANRDWKGDLIMPEPSPFAPYQDPKSERYWSTVGTPFKSISRFVNSVTGGNELVSGHLDISPEALEHLTEHFTGGAGQTILDGFDYVLKVSTGKEWKGNDVPIVKRFIASPSSFYELESFKELREKSNQAKDMLAIYRKEGEKEKAKEHLKINEPFFKIYGSVKKTESYIREINKKMRVVSASRKLSNVEKATRLRRLKQLKLEAMRRTHSRFVKMVNPA